MTELYLRETQPSDIDTLFEIRAATRENPISRERLAQSGITPESSVADLNNGTTRGWVCLHRDRIVGFCTGNRDSGEVLVLAVLPDYEGRSIGKALLVQVVEWLRQAGPGKVWLAAAPDPGIRAYGFYRSLGWRPNGCLDSNGDEILELPLPVNPAPHAMH